MEYRVRQYEKYKRHIKFMLSCSGLWPDDRSSRFLRKCLNIFSALITSLSFYCVFAFCLKNATSLSHWLKGLGLLIGLFSAFLKVCVLSRQEKDLRSLNDGISTSFERHLEDAESREHLLTKFPIFSGFFHFYSFWGLVVPVMLAITPLMLLRHGKYARIFPFHLPFDYEMGGTIHWLVHVFEVLSGFYLWTVNTGTDSVFGLYALHVVGELRLLSDRFRNLKSGPNYKKDLKEYITSHYLLMETRLLLERVFGLLAIYLAITCAVSLCTLVFQSTQIKNMTPVRIFYLISHCFTKLVQASSYSWYGNTITVESEKCLMSIYDARWNGSGDTQFMRDVVIVISQRSLIFRAKGFMYLSLDTFSKILHATASYFFLLQTLDEKA